MTQLAPSRAAMSSKAEFSILPAEMGRVLKIPDTFSLNGSGISGQHPHQSLGLMMDSQRYLKAMDWLPSEMLPRKRHFAFQEPMGTMLSDAFDPEAAAGARARSVATRSFQ